MKGYVYVLTNEAMPGLVKIGRSKHAAGVRAKALYKGDTGVPLPFDIHFECLFDDCVEGEAWVHEELEDYRINPRREFFRVDSDDATAAVMRVRANKIDHTVEFSDMVPDESVIFSLSDQLGQHPFEVVTALSFLTADELRPAMNRWLDRLGLTANSSLALVDDK